MLRLYAIAGCVIGSGRSWTRSVTCSRPTGAAGGGAAGVQRFSGKPPAGWRGSPLPFADMTPYGSSDQHGIRAQAGLETAHTAMQSLIEGRTNDTERASQAVNAHALLAVADALLAMRPTPGDS